MTLDRNELDVRVDRLYALPHGEFTAARTELSKALRATGEREAADAVKALRKPTLTAWAVNQLFHHYPDIWAELMEGTDRIRRAHATGTEALASAFALRKAALATAVEVTEGILSRAGSPPSTVQTRRITGSIEALASGAGEARPGRLSIDLEPPGFGGLAGLELAVAPGSMGQAGTGGETRPRRPVSEPATSDSARTRERSAPGAEAPAESTARRARAVEKARHALDKAVAALSSATADAEAARKVRTEGESHVREAATATEAAKAAADAARARLLDAQSAQATLERRVKKLAAEEDSAERALERARKSLAEARAAVDRLSGGDAGNRA